MAVTLTKSHYILLIQVSDNPSSRTFSDFESLHECMEGITKIYEDYLTEAYPTREGIQFDMASLVKFLKALRDLSCLVYSSKFNMYKPQGKDWIVQELYKHLSKKSQCEDSDMTI